MLQTRVDIINYIMECEKTNIYMMTLGKNVYDMHTHFTENEVKWIEEYSQKTNFDDREM